MFSSSFFKLRDIVMIKMYFQTGLLRFPRIANVKDD